MSEGLLFHAEIIPHRSLSPRALRALLRVICALCGTTALMFVWLGAWPVGGFTGLELLLAAFLFRLNARGVRGVEIITLSAAGLLVQRTDPSGARRELRLPPSWLRLELEERPGRAPALILSERARRIEVARDLGEEEKRDLAASLAQALDNLRNPRWDNPQLREDQA